MSGYDETNPEAYRPTEPEAAADGAHSGVDSWSASSQASPATASSVSEGASVTEDHGGYADLSQAYTADASQPEPPTSQLPAEPPTSQLPAEQSASLYAQPAQGQYQPQQPSYQPQQQPQGQYPAPQVQQAAPSSYSSAQQPYQGQQTHLGSPYMSVPTTPGGYAPAGAPTGESFYAASKATGADSGTKRRRRGPGWFALVASVLVASLLGAGGAVGAIKALDARDGGASQRSTAAPTAIATGSTTKTVNSAGQAPDWEAVSAAVSHAADLAVIQLKDAPDNLTVAQLGDSDKLATGQDVMAIGSPLGLSSTVTTGIISALDRPVVNSQNEDGSGGSAVYTNAIQIDAAINPGNSGGPLFDEKGRVIGITSSIATMSRSGGGEGGSGSIGIGFAIPVKLADKVAKQLIKSGTATHAYLGVSLDTAGATADGEKRAGAKITSVEGGSPADKAGLKKDDVVIAIDGKTTAQGSALTGYVRQYSANDKVKLTVIRDSKKQDIDVTLAERKDA